MDVRFGLAILALAAASADLGPAQPPQSDTVRNPLADSPTAVSEGQRLYNQTCQSCHGPAGQGDRGPALDASPLAHGDGDGDLFHTVREGLPGTQMPPFAALSDTQVWQLVSYIRSLKGTASAGGALGTAIPAIGDAAGGEALFFGRAGCATCHEVNGRGGIVGPDLSGAGRNSGAALRQKIVDPNNPLPATPGAGGRGGGGGRGGPVPATVIVKTQDGRETRGIRRNEDMFSVQMVDTTGTIRLFDKRKLTSVQSDPRSLMPADYGSRLSASDIDNLVAYLANQKGRDLAKTGVQPMLPGGVTSERLRKATGEPQNWLMYWGDYQGTHASSLKQIDAGNVGKLQGIWSMPLPGSVTLEATPIVADGIMYVTTSGDPLAVVAVDARSGRQVWRYSRPQKVKNPYEINPFNRGVAILGHRLFVGTLDAALISLDARTGLPMWEIQVADSMEGYTITSPPLVVNDKVLVGISCGEFGTRGFIDAYDAASGRRLWRFNTVPGPGEFGNDTWKGDSWRRGGTAAWLTGTYDPELNTVYWAMGNPAPQIDRFTRGELDNLFSCSVVALDPETGRRKWHYQFTPNDGHDWDSVQDMMLVDRMWHGQNRKLLLHADRNGIFYVLDRTNGTFLQGTPFVHQTWNAGFDATGRPIVVPNSNSSPEGSILVYPTLGGGTNFQSPSYSSTTGLFYLEYAEGGAQYTSATAEFEQGRQYIGRSPARGAGPARGPSDPPPSSGIKALDPETGRTVWDVKTFQGSLTNGLLVTAGNVVFASTRDGNLIALDARTGTHLWHYQTGGSHAASPISYAVDGRQYVALSGGNTVHSFALPEQP
jgi:PQQ-dependent dehydrogenase (methanol/ethanol family)